MAADQRSEQLDSVAKTLAASVTTLGAILTALGVTTDLIQVGLANDDGYRNAFFLAVGAVILSIIAIALRPERVEWQAVTLVVAVSLFAVASLVAIDTATQQARGNGRPTITSVMVDRADPSVTIAIEITADGVPLDQTIRVLVQSIELGQSPDPLNPELVAVGPSQPIYGADLRPDPQGVVTQKIDFAFDPGNANNIRVRIWSSVDGSPRCETGSFVGAGCLTVVIPSASTPTSAPPTS